MTRRWWMAGAAAMALSVAFAAAQSPDGRTLQRAIDLIESKGDVRTARPLLEEAAKSSDRAIAARALLYLAQVTATTDPGAARRVLERIVAEYSDQKAVVDAARARLGSELAQSRGMPRLLCEHCGDVYGAVSADGRFMATVSPFFGGENTGDIGVLDLSSQKLTPLHIEGSGRSPTGVALSPLFSPDASHIAYAWGIQATSAFELRIVRRDGGKPRVIVSNPEIRYLEPHGWSRNGSLLVLLQRPDQTWEVALVSTDTGAVAKIKSLDWRISGPLHESSLSHDGRFIVYAALSTNPAAPVPVRQSHGLERQIYVLAADGTGEVAVTSGAGVKHNPVWTPDGSHVLYLSNVGGQWDLWAVPMRAGAPSGQPVLVKNDLGEVTSLGMTRAGGYHYYQGRSGVVRTAIVRWQSGRPDRPPVAEDKVVGARPSWSPDGRSIAVTRADSAGNVEIVVRTLATGDERVFRHSRIAPFPVSWFPDSRGLLFQAGGNQPEWFRADFETGVIRALAPVIGEGFRTHGSIRTLGPDGRTFYLGTSVREGEQVFDRVTALDLQTGTRRDVFTLPIGAASLPRAAQDIAIAISPDGRSLALFYRDRAIERARLATVGVDGLGYKELVEPAEAHNLRTKLVWSADGRWIYFTTAARGEGVTNADTDVHRIMRVAAAGGLPEFTGVTVDGLERFDLSPDGTRLAYSSLRPEGAGELLWNLDVSWLTKPGR